LPNDARIRAHRELNPFFSCNLPDGPFLGATPVETFALRSSETIVIIDTRQADQFVALGWWAHSSSALGGACGSGAEGWHRADAD
jgi:hypothetical protein